MLTYDVVAACGSTEVLLSQDVLLGDARDAAVGALTRHAERLSGEGALGSWVASTRALARAARACGADGDAFVAPAAGGSGYFEVRVVVRAERTLWRVVFETLGRDFDQSGDVVTAQAVVAASGPDEARVRVIEDFDLPSYVDGATGTVCSAHVVSVGLARDVFLIGCAPDANGRVEVVS